MEYPREFINSVGINVDVISIDTTDGLRMTLNDGDIIHLRPSGNAPELRFYVESNSSRRALDLINLCWIKFNSLD
ncbi:hypothetical protein M6C35_002538 [Vibrio metschnikovii]|nr:hypothetical protein [Vibrio metschnikovii]